MDTRFKKGHVPHNKTEHIRKVCKCGVEFFVKPSLDRVQSCSRSCAKKGHASSERQKEAARKAVTGNKFMLGKRAWNKGMKGFMAGENHYNWKGGYSQAYRERRNGQYKTWRTEVFQRDDYTCKGCGQKGGYLTAHHIKSFARYPDLRYDIDNGITLCEPCHSATDNYKGRGIKNNQLVK